MLCDGYCWLLSAVLLLRLSSAVWVGARLPLLIEFKRGLPSWVDAFARWANVLYCSVLVRAAFLACAASVFNVGSPTGLMPLPTGCCTVLSLLVCSVLCSFTVPPVELLFCLGGCPL